MLTKSRSGLSVPRHLNSRYFPELMSYIDLVASTTVDFIPHPEIEDSSRHSGNTDSEILGPKEEFKTELIYFLSQGISFLKSIGLAYFHVHNKTLDNERVFSAIDFIRKPGQLEDSEFINSLLVLGAFHHSGSKINVLSPTDIEIFLGISNTDQTADINIEFEILIGALIVIRTLDTPTQGHETFYAADLFVRSITSPKRAMMPSGFNMEDMIHMLKSSRLGKMEIVNTISKFGSKQKAFLPLLESYLFKTGKNKKTLLYPISVGYGDFNDVEKMGYSLKQLQHLPFNGQYIFFVSDTWHKFTYNAKESFKNIIEDLTITTEQKTLSENSLEEKATNEGQVWVEANSSIINQLNKQKAPCLAELENTKKISNATYDDPDNSTLSDISSISSSEDEAEQKNTVNRVHAPRCNYFDPATNYLEQQTKEIKASSDIFDTYPSLAFPEPTDQFEREETLPQIRAFQLAYFIFLYGKFIYLNDIIKQDDTSSDCKDIDKFLFPTNLLTKAELTNYYNDLRNHLSEYSHFIILKENLSFFSGAKKVFQYISSSSTKMLTKDCMTMKKNELTKYILESPERTLSFYSAQQESCKYSIFTMSMVIYFSYTYNLGNQCYPGQINGWWEELIKINQELKKERLGSALFRNQSRSVTGTPERNPKAMTTTPGSGQSTDSTKGSTTDDGQTSDSCASSPEDNFFFNLFNTHQNHKEQLDASPTLKLGSSKGLI